MPWIYVPDDDDRPDPPPPPPMVTWRGPIAYLDQNTVDRRRIADLTWRDLPLPVMFVDPSAAGHAGAFVVGRLVDVEIVGDGAAGRRQVMGTIESNQLHPEVRYMCGVDLDSVVVVPADINGNPLDPNQDPPDDAIELLTSGRLVAVTLYAEPSGAFPDAYVEAVAQ